MTIDQSHLTDLQKHVIFEQGTEAPFTNKYWDNNQEGIYVDVISGKALFSSKDKFNSGSGWPSFSKPIDYSVIEEIPDNSHHMARIEVRAKESNIHLGHVFDDGPKQTGGKRYCINSAALDFIDITSVEKAVLAGGNIPNPTYEHVSLGIGNYAQSIEVIFNSNKISYEEIIRFFFKIHNPTTLNQQGNDSGPQYRSVIFYLNDQQKTVATDLIMKADQSEVFPGKIVIELDQIGIFKFMQLSNTYYNLGTDFYQQQPLSKVKDFELITYNHQLAEQLLLLMLGINLVTLCHN
jgi:peptide methionine sulfoxide reductase msrA/msrB